MNPKGVKFRECRDSDAHPNSTGIVFALDVSGSMGEIPRTLATQTLPAFMKTMLEAGVQDPQVLFMAVGHAVSDRAPLQVGQFESTEKLMDQWLTLMFLEGGGAGGNESYEVAMYFAARHTLLDSIEKRQKKGYFFVTGDEPTNPAVVGAQVEKLIGDSLPADIPTADIVRELSQKYEYFYLIPDPGRGGVKADWARLMGERVIVMPAPEETGYVAAALVALCEGLVPTPEAAVAGFVRAGLTQARANAIAACISPFARSR
jgi:hypothetical protein